MEPALLETWHVVCATPPAFPESSPHVSWVVHPHGSELCDLGRELSGLDAAAVITISARIVDAGGVRRFATSLADASGGAVLADPPMLWKFRNRHERPLPPRDAWQALARDAERAAAAAGERDKVEWQPDPDDTWEDIL